MSNETQSSIETVRELLREVVRSLMRIEEHLTGQSEARSSVEVRTSTRGYDIATKAYSGSPIQAAGDSAVSEYLRVRAALESQLMGEKHA